MLTRLSLLLALLAVAAIGTLACFSTIAPDTEGTSGSPGDDANVATVRGKVLRFESPGNFVGHPTTVRAVWLGPGGVQLGETVTSSNNDGVYEAQTTQARVTHVVVAAWKCSYTETNTPRRFTCCLEDPPCPEGCASRWDAEYKLPIVIGSTAFKDHRLHCPTD